MPDSYRSLRHARLGQGTLLKQDSDTVLVSRRAPATDVMTDLKHATAYTITPTSTIEQAEHKMILCGVRLLFVTDGDDELMGLITTTDIHGERPLNYLREHAGNRSEIMVQEIMTHRDEIEALTYPDVVRASVGDIVATLHDAGRQHILVTERNCVRGLFSATTVARALGESVDIQVQPRTFAEIEAALVSH